MAVAPKESMPQPFPPWTNAVAKWAPPLFVLALMAGVTAYAAGLRSDYYTGVGEAIVQPVPFSHRHHVKGLGLDCRFCHASVDRSAFAGLPDTHTCMGCHSQIWPTAPVLAPVRDSYARGIPIAWRRVNRLPDHVYFEHAAHVRKGIGCVTCHGNIGEETFVMKSRPFFMFECIDCHRDPAKHLRPISEIYNAGWDPPDQESMGATLARTYKILSPSTLTQCTVCHR
jgi:hypothetical protein